MFHSRKRVIIFFLILLFATFYLYFVFDVEDYIVARTIPKYPGAKEWSVKPNGLNPFEFIAPLSNSYISAKARISFYVTDNNPNLAASSYETLLEKNGWGKEDIREGDVTIILYSKNTCSKITGCR